MAKLTTKQQRFIKEYLISGNATQAAKLAGYSEKTAYRTGADNLKKPQIVQAIANGQKRVSDKLDIKLEDVVAELLKLAMSNMDDYAEVQPDGSAVVDLNDLSRDQMAAITELTSEVYSEGHGDAARDVKRTKIKLGSKEGALDKLMRHLGGYSKDKLELLGSVVVKNKIDFSQRPRDDG